MYTFVWIFYIPLFDWVCKRCSVNGSVCSSVQIRSVQFVHELSPIP